ncbi:MAG: hypothetical protein M3541_02025 [Acidobacteriota bacterium]|nr:hypothetical protein [Acidobacteriota bacterium]MDQ3417552.1 hypothetical protein [Acidobacteriota bacterium]
MFATVLVALMLLVPQAGKPVAVPDTPQGKHLKAYLDAFNSGDKKKYLAMIEEHFDPITVKDRPVEERAKMFQRLKGDFGTFKVTKVTKASAEAIGLLIPNKEGVEATFNFRFAATAPFKINGIGVDIERGEP